MNLPSGISVNLSSQALLGTFTSIRQNAYIYIMNTITLQLPDTFELNQRDTVRFLAAKLYETAKLSLGQAAELAGLSKPTFAEILADYGVSIINYSIEDVVSDAANI